MANSNRYKEIISKIKQEGRTVTESELVQDRDWIESAKVIYKMDTGKDFKGDDKEATAYGIDRMSKFNYNVSLGTIPDAATISSKSYDEKIAFMYLMDTYDDKDITWAGVKRGLLNTLEDPATIAGVMSSRGGFASLLHGKFVGMAAKSAAKEGIKRKLMGDIKSFVMKETVQGAIAGGAYAGVQNVAQQQVKTQAGLQKGISGKEAMANVAVGTGVGLGIGKGVEVASPYIAKGVKAVGRNLKNLLQEYRQSIPKELGFKAAKSGEEIAIYDTELANKSLVKKGKK